MEGDKSVTSLEDPCSEPRIPDRALVFCAAAGGLWYACDPLGAMPAALRRGRAAAGSAQMTEPRPGATPERRVEPKQTRGVETRRTILDAAAGLFAEQGYEATTTHQIAAAAGVSVGALYRYFADKEAVLVELYRHEQSERRERILGQFSLVELVGKDLAGLVRKAMELAFQVFGERAALRRVLVEQSRRVPALAALRGEQERTVRETVRQILAAAPGVRVPDREVAAYLVVLFMDALIDDWTLYRRELGLEQARLIEGAVDFILWYALRRPPIELEA
jgi:AcrR family transcriptional regulator